MKAHTKNNLKIAAATSITVFSLFAFMVSAFAWFTISTTATVSTDFQAEAIPSLISRVDIYQLNDLNADVGEGEFTYRNSPCMSYVIESGGKVTKEYRSITLSIDEDTSFIMVPDDSGAERDQTNPFVGTWNVLNEDTSQGRTQLLINADGSATLNGPYANIYGGNYSWTPWTDGKGDTYQEFTNKDPNRTNSLHASIGPTIGMYDTLKVNRSLLYVFTVDEKQSSKENANLDIVIKSETTMAESLLYRGPDGTDSEPTNWLRPNSPEDPVKTTPKGQTTVVRFYPLTEGIGHAVNSENGIVTNVTAIDVSTQAAKATITAYPKFTMPDLKGWDDDGVLEIYSRKKVGDNYEDLPTNIGMIVQYDPEIIEALYTLNLSAYALETNRVIYDCDWGVEIK